MTKKSGGGFSKAKEFTVQGPHGKGQSAPKGDMKVNAKGHKGGNPGEKHGK